MVLVDTSQMRWLNQIDAHLFEASAPPESDETENRRFVVRVKFDTVASSSCLLIIIIYKYDTTRKKYRGNC